MIRVTYLPTNDIQIMSEAEYISWKGDMDKSFIGWMEDYFIEY